MGVDATTDHWSKLGLKLHQIMDYPHRMRFTFLIAKIHDNTIGPKSFGIWGVRLPALQITIMTIV